MSSKITAATARRALATVTLAVALVGCQSRVARERNPSSTGWTSVDAGARDVRAARDAPTRDAALSRDATLRDAASEDGRRDAAIDGTGRGRDGDGRDRGGRDAGPRDLGQDLPGLPPRDAVAADSGPAPCGPGHFHCTPYACDVDTGQCKNFCTGDDDCESGKPCVNGLCDPNFNALCQVDQECASGHCASGVCCTTACAGACRSCAVPGTLGVCSPVPAGMPDPQRICPAATVCGADAGCVSAPDAASSN
ncbi:MAG TPA: hypothetical protein VI456_16245 [Polyangia bacterium]